MGNHIGTNIERGSHDEDEKWLKMSANDLFDLEVLTKQLPGISSLNADSSKKIKSNQSNKFTENEFKSTVDIAELCNVFTSKDPLRLNEDEMDLYNSHANIEDSIKYFLFENRSIGGLNGFVSGGPRAINIFTKLQESINKNSDYIGKELHKSIRSRAMLRLHLAISRRYNASKSKKMEVSKNDIMESKRDTINASNDSLTTLIKPIRLTVFTDSSKLSVSKPMNQEQILNDLLFASGLTISIATVESLYGTEMYDTILRNIFMSLIRVFTKTIRSLSPLDRRKISLSRTTSSESLYSHSISTPMITDTIQQWNTSDSSAALHFSKNARSVGRARDRSSVPPTKNPLIALSKLSSPITSFSVMIITSESETATRPFSIGFSHHSIMNHLSEGFGRYNCSWGLREERQVDEDASDYSPSDTPTRTGVTLYSNGTEVSTFRSLKTGDIISFIVNLQENWCDIVINFDKLMYRFNMTANDLPSTDPNDYLFGAIIMDNDKLSILPHSFSDLLNYFGEGHPDIDALLSSPTGIFYQPKTSSSFVSRTLECPSKHPLFRHTNTPQYYIDRIGHSAGVNCDICSRSSIQNDSTCFYNCSQCDYDICLMCSLPPPIITTKSKHNRSADILLLSASPFVHISPDSETLIALDKTVALARQLILNAATTTGSTQKQMITQPVPARGTSSFLDRVQALKSRDQPSIDMSAESRVNSLHKTIEFSTSNIAISYMLSIAVLKESLESLMEVIFLLTDENILSYYEDSSSTLSSITNKKASTVLYQDLYRSDVKVTYPTSKRLQILPIAIDFINRLRGTHSDFTAPSVATSASNDSKNILQSLMTETSHSSVHDEFFTPSPRSARSQSSISQDEDINDYMRVFEAHSWTTDPYLLPGDKQAIELLICISEISAGSNRFPATTTSSSTTSTTTMKKAFCICHDIYLDIFVTMIERGAILLHQAAALHMKGNYTSVKELLGTRQARIAIYMASAALKITYCNLHVLAYHKRNQGGALKTILDVPTYGVSLIRQDLLLDISRKLSSVSPRSPITSTSSKKLATHTIHVASQDPTVSMSFRQRIVQVLDLLITNPMLHPDRSHIGSGAVLYAGLHDILRPKASEQFSVICGLLEKSDADIDTPCERALVISLMSSMEGPKLLELITPLSSSSVSADSTSVPTTTNKSNDIEEGDVEKFIRSILLLADRSLISKIKKLWKVHMPSTYPTATTSISIESNKDNISVKGKMTTSHKSLLDPSIPKLALDKTVSNKASSVISSPLISGRHDSMDDIGEGILRVLEPTTIQTFCNLSYHIDQSIHHKHDAVTLQYLDRLVDLLTHLISSAKSTLSHYITLFESFEAQYISSHEKTPLLVNENMEMSPTIDDMYLKYDEFMQKSHITHLVPLILFGVSLLWKTMIANGYRREMGTLVNLFEPLNELAVVLAPIESLEKRFRPLLQVKIDPSESRLKKDKAMKTDIMKAVTLPSVNKWDVSASNNNLIFTDNDTCCRRPGSASCYPAAVATIPASKSTFSVTLTEAMSTTNWLTIGVSTTGFAVSSSDGFGRTNHTWGIADDRSKDSETAFFAVNNQRVHAAPRKLKTDDIVHITLDLDTPKLTITVNHGEFSYTFQQPTCSPPVGHFSAFWYGATFANDHKLKINPTIYTPPPSLPTVTTEEGTWVERFSREIRELQYLVVQQYLEYPISGLTATNKSKSSTSTTSERKKKTHNGSNNNFERFMSTNNGSGRRSSIRVVESSRRDEDEEEEGGGGDDELMNEAFGIDVVSNGTRESNEYNNHSDEEDDDDDDDDDEGTISGSSDDDDDDDDATRSSAESEEIEEDDEDEDNDDENSDEEDDEEVDHGGNSRRRILDELVDSVSLSSSRHRPSVTASSIGDNNLSLLNTLNGGRRNNSSLGAIMRALQLAGNTGTGASNTMSTKSTSGKSKTSSTLTSSMSEELSHVHSWCDSPLLMHGMFDQTTEFTTESKPNINSGQVQTSTLSMTCLSPLPQEDGFFTSDHTIKNNLSSTVSKWALLRQLTDAPNGIGDAQRLVGIMKKYVREDQGAEAGPNHAVHATCAALIWHEGLAGEALEIVNASKANIDKRPSYSLQSVWKRSQSMRAVFPESYEDTVTSSSNVVQSSDDLGTADADIPPPPIAMNRQFSLPAQPSPLKPATLAAVRRARLLLSYYPATEVSTLSSDAITPLTKSYSMESLTRSSMTKSYFDDIRENHCINVESKSGSTIDKSTKAKLNKSLTISDCVLNFIQHGPDPDLVRKIAEERSQLAQYRTKGFTAALELLKSTSDRKLKVDLLVKISESIVCSSKLVKVMNTSPNKKGKDKKEVTLTPKEVTDSTKLDVSTFRFQGCHYSSTLYGCTRQMKAQVEKIWLELVTEVSTLGIQWLTELEALVTGTLNEKEDTSSSSSGVALDKTSSVITSMKEDRLKDLEMSLMAVLSIIGMDYREQDVEYIISSGVYALLTSCASSTCGPIRTLAMNCLEQLVHLTCRIQQETTKTGQEAAAAFHSDDKILPSAKELLHLVLKYFSQKSREYSSQSRMTVSTEENDSYLKRFEMLNTHEKYQPLPLLLGQVICDPYEEGLVLKPTPFLPTIAPNDSTIPPDLNQEYQFSDHSLSFWVYIEKGCHHGLLLSRLMGHVDPWSFITIRIIENKLVLLMGNKSTIGNNGSIENYLNQSTLYTPSTTTTTNASTGSSSGSENELFYCGVNMSTFEGINMTSKQTVPENQWVHVTYAVDARRGLMYLYVNDTIDSTIALHSTMITSPFPFPELLSHSNSSTASNDTIEGQPFIVGQVPTALASIGRSARCVMCNIVLCAYPLNLLQVIQLMLTTLPSDHYKTREVVTSSADSDYTSVSRGLQDKHHVIDHLKFVYTRHEQDEGILVEAVKQPNQIEVSDSELKPMTRTTLYRLIPSLDLDSKITFKVLGESLNGFSIGMFAYHDDANDGQGSTTTAELHRKLSQFHLFDEGVSSYGLKNHNFLKGCFQKNLQYQKNNPKLNCVQNCTALRIQHGEIITLRYDSKLKFLFIQGKHCGAQFIIDDIKTNKNVKLCFAVSLCPYQKVLLLQTIKPPVPVEKKDSKKVDSEDKKTDIGNNTTTTNSTKALHVDIIVNTATFSALTTSPTVTSTPSDYNQVMSSFTLDLSDQLRLDIHESTVYYPSIVNEENAYAPMALCQITKPRASFTCMLTRNVMIDDVLSIGMAKMYAKPRNDAEMMTPDVRNIYSFFRKKSGFGMQRDSYGLYDVRNEENSDQAALGGDTSPKIKTFRKLHDGDLITFTVDFLSSPVWLEIDINGGEFKHKFYNIQGHYSQYVFGIVMAMEHEFVLIPDSSILDSLPIPSSTAVSGSTTDAGDNIADSKKTELSIKNMKSPYNLDEYFPKEDTKCIQFYTWNYENVLYQNTACGLEAYETCNKNDIIHLFSQITRIHKSILSLTIVDNKSIYESTLLSNIGKSTSSPFHGLYTEWIIQQGLLQSFFIMSWQSYSSTIRLASTKVLKQIVPLLSPDIVNKAFRQYLSSISSFISSSDTALKSDFLGSMMVSAGSCLNPYSQLHMSCSLSAQDTTVDESLFRIANCISEILFDDRYNYTSANTRQCLDILYSLSSSPLKAWWSEYTQVIRDIVPSLLPYADTFQQYLEDARLVDQDTLTNRAGYQLFNDAIRHISQQLRSEYHHALVGLFALLGGHIPSQALVPGSIVTHMGYGSSLSEKYVVIGYSQISLFGETVTIAPLVHDPSDSSDITTSSSKTFTIESEVLDISQPDSPRLLETVFATYLQSEQVHQQVLPAVYHAIIKNNHIYSDISRLLSKFITLDTADQRPPYQLEIEHIQPQNNQVERSIILESPHPYRDNTDELYEITIPGATELIITFDAQSKTEANYDYLRFFKDTSQTSYWGQEKYSGTTWPGVNGVDPLRIGAGFCLMQFHTDGSNNDWGYKFTVVGVMNIEAERPLRPACPALALGRILKSMALEASIKTILRKDVNYVMTDQTSVLLSKPSSPVTVDKTLPEPIPIYMAKKDFFIDIFNSLLSSITLYGINVMSKHIKMKSNDTKEVDLSMIPSVSSTYIARILQTYRSVANLKSTSSSTHSTDCMDGDKSSSSSTTTTSESSRMKTGASMSELLYMKIWKHMDELASIDQQSIATMMSQYASPKENEDKVDNFKEISPALAATLSVSSTSSMYACPDHADLSALNDFMTTTDSTRTIKRSMSAETKIASSTHPSKREITKAVDIDSPNNISYNGAVQFRLKCSSPTTHCRIRAGPSLDAAEVGEIVNCSIVEISGAINDFYKLADGRGYVIICVENAVAWERVDVHSSAKRTAQLSIMFLDQLLMHELDALVAWSSYRLLTYMLSDTIVANLLFANSNTNPMKAGNMHLLLKIAGLGQLRSPKTIKRSSRQESKRELLVTTPLLRTLKRSLTSLTQNATTITANSLNTISDIHIPTDHTQLLITMMNIVSGILASKAKYTAEEIALNATNSPKDAKTEPVATLIKPVVIESEHEYQNNTDHTQFVRLPGATGLEITFDEECSTERNYDYVAFYSDAECKNMLAGKFSGRKSSSEKNWPGVGDRPSLIFEDRDSCYISFITDGSNTDWGWKLTVSPLNSNTSQEKPINDLILRSVIPMDSTVSTLVTTPKSDTMNTQKFAIGLTEVELGEGILKPSLGVALALLDLILDSNISAEFLFTSTTGCTLIGNLSLCAGGIGEASPWLARTFFDIVTRVTMLYRQYRKLPVTPYESIPYSYTQIRDTMVSMSKHVLMLTYFATTSRRNNMNANNKSSYASPLYQSICQAAVISATSICFDNTRFGPLYYSDRSDSVIDTQHVILPDTTSPKENTDKQIEHLEHIKEIVATDSAEEGDIGNDDVDLPCTPHVPFRQKLREEPITHDHDDDDSSSDDDSEVDYGQLLGPTIIGPIFPSVFFPTGNTHNAFSPNSRTAVYHDYSSSASSSGESISKTAIPSGDDAHVVPPPLVEEEEMELKYPVIESDARDASEQHLGTDSTAATYSTARAMQMSTATSAIMNMRMMKPLLRPLISTNNKEQGYSYTNYIYVSKWSHSQYSVQPFAIGVQLTSDLVLEISQGSSLKPFETISLSWISYAHSSSNNTEDYQPFSRFVWKSNTTSAAAVLGDSYDADSSSTGSDGDDLNGDDHHVFNTTTTITGPHATALKSVLSNAYFREGDIISVSLIVKPEPGKKPLTATATQQGEINEAADTKEMKEGSGKGDDNETKDNQVKEEVADEEDDDESAAQLVFTRNGDDVAYFDIHFDLDGCIDFSVSEHSNIVHLTLAPDVITATNNLTDSTKSNAVNDTMDITNDANKPTVVSGSTSAKKTKDIHDLIQKFSDVNQRLTDVNNKLRQNINAAFQLTATATTSIQGDLLTDTDTEVPLLYNPRGDGRPLPSPPLQNPDVVPTVSSPSRVTTKPISSYFPITPTRTRVTQSPRTTIGDLVSTTADNDQVVTTADISSVHSSPFQALPTNLPLPPTPTNSRVPEFPEILSTATATSFSISATTTSSAVGENLSITGGMSGLPPPIPSRSFGTTTRNRSRTTRDRRVPKSRGVSNTSSSSDLVQENLVALNTTVLSETVGKLHAEIKAEYDELGSRRTSHVPPSPKLHLYYGDQYIAAATGLIMTLSLNIPLGGEVEYLSPNEVPFYARRQSSIPFGEHMNTIHMVDHTKVSDKAPILPSDDVTKDDSLSAVFKGTILTTWDQAISESELIFTDSNRVARRPGAVSCYPASLTKVPMNIDTMYAFTMLLTKAPPGPNSMSIGVAIRGFKSSGSDGFGLSTNSWGLIESRSANEGKIYANHVPVDTFRKMKEGDVFSLMYDRSLGKCWFTLGHCATYAMKAKLQQIKSEISNTEEWIDMNTIITEYHHEFTIHPPRDRVDVFFGATYCNDHELRILNMPPLTIPKGYNTTTESKSSAKSMSLFTLPDILSATAAAASSAFHKSQEINRITAWDLNLSNAALRFTNNNQTVMRPGNVSCYPAALVPVPTNTKSVFTTVLEECPYANNTMSIGIAVKGFPKSGQQAFGERVESWGILNNRSESSKDELSKIQANAISMDTFRRLEKGDRFELIYDPVDHTAEFFINNNDYYCKFTLLPNKEYVFGATFCNNHCLTILSGDSNTLNNGKDTNKGMKTSSSSTMLSSDDKKLSAVSTTTPSADILTIPFSVYLDQVINLSVLANNNPIQSTPHSSSSSQPLKSTSLIESSTTITGASKAALTTTATTSTPLPINMEMNTKLRKHAIKRYNKECERILKELRLSLLPPGKQIKVINCSMQASLLPGDLHALSCLLTVLNLLQAEPYPTWSASANNSSSSSSSSSADQRRSTVRPANMTRSTYGVPNWRELIPGHVIYRQVLPYVMSRNSQYIQLPVLSATSKVVRRVKVDGAVGYAMQWLQPPHIPATHVLRITAYVYSYSPTIMQANMEAKRTRTEHSLNTRKDEIPHKDKVYLKKQLICEWYGCNTSTVSVSDGTKDHKQSLVSCSHILQAASTNLVTYRPNPNEVHEVKSHIPFYVGDMVIRTPKGSTTSPVTTSTSVVSKEDISTPVDMKTNTSTDHLERKETVSTSHIPGEIGDVYEVRGPFEDTSVIPSVDSHQVPTSPLKGKQNKPKIFEVCVRWRDSNHRDIYLIPEKDLNSSTSSTNSMKYEIVLWKPNPMSRIEGSAEAIASGSVIDIFDGYNYLWTPMLTREIEIALTPIHPTTTSTNTTTAGMNASEDMYTHKLEEYISQDMNGYASMLITPILVPSSVVHSASYINEVEKIVNHHSLLDTLTPPTPSVLTSPSHLNTTSSSSHIKDESVTSVQSSAVMSSDRVYNTRDQIDTSLVKLIELTLQQKGHNNERGLPDTWTKVAVSADDVNHYPILTLCIHKESEWMEQYLNDSLNTMTHPSNNSTTLTAIRSEIFSYRYALIRQFNIELSACLDLFNMNAVSYKPSSVTRLKHISLLYSTIVDMVTRCRGYIFTWVKDSFIQKTISNTSAEAGSATKFELVISRSRAAKFTAKGEVDYEGRWSVFGQAFRRIHGMPASVLRRSGQLWETVFAGERSHDSGGPYREAWSAIIADIMSPTLPLLVPCPNNEGKVGMNQETYLLNPNCARNSTQLEMLVFFGKLMGSAARSNNYLDLYLSPLIWKLLVRQPVSIEDIKDIDITAYNQFMTYKYRKGITEEKFGGYDLHFSVMNKGGTMVELHPGGAMEPVKWGADIDRYCQELEEYWLYQESTLVVEAVRAGLVTQIPAATLHLLRWEEVEEMVCGKPEINVQLLQSVVEYERGCSATDQHVIWLWELLKQEFTSDDKKAFIRFAWGRSRLPLNEAAFTQRFKLQGFSRSSVGGNIDNYLPVSHTCFFSVELPRYSSKEVLKQKLLYAIHNCTAIDGDDTGAGMRAAALGMET